MLKRSSATVVFFDILAYSIAFWFSFVPSGVLDAEPDSDIIGAICHHVL